MLKIIVMVTVNEITFNRLTNVFVLIIVIENHTADKNQWGIEMIALRSDRVKKQWG